MRLNAYLRLTLEKNVGRMKLEAILHVLTDRDGATQEVSSKDDVKSGLFKWTHSTPKLSLCSKIAYEPWSQKIYRVNIKTTCEKNLEKFTNAAFISVLYSVYRVKQLFNISVLYMYCCVNAEKIHN